MASASSLADRVREIIQRRTGGDVASFATQAGVNLRHLYRVLNGEIEDPRFSFFHSVAKRYITEDMRWLITGRGLSKDDVDAVTRAHVAATLRSLADGVDKASRKKQPAQPGAARAPKGAEFAARLQSVVDTECGGDANELARRIGASSRTVYKSLSRPGTTAGPRYESLRSILLAFPDIDARWLLTGASVVRDAHEAASKARTVVELRRILQDLTA